MCSSRGLDITIFKAFDFRVILGTYRRSGISIENRIEHIQYSTTIYSFILVNTITLRSVDCFISYPTCIICYGIIIEGSLLDIDAGTT